MVWDDDISQSRKKELRDEMDLEAFRRFDALLGRQAKTRWYELGYNDDSSRKTYLNTVVGTIVRINERTASIDPGSTSPFASPTRAKVGRR